MESINGGYLKGKMEIIKEWNDKEHEVLFCKLETLQDDITNLKIGAGKEGAKWGAIVSFLTLVALVIVKWVWDSLYKQ